jgi:repressor LexA
MAKLHPTQVKLLTILKKGSLEGRTLRDIASEIGVDHPFTVSHHLKQLQRDGYLRINPANPSDYQILKEPAGDVAYLNVYSENAQCGPEGLFTEEHVVDRIPLSTEQFGITNSADYFLVKARGDSMEPKIHEEDYILAQRTEILPNGSLAVITHDGVAKIKKFWTEAGGRHKLLVSLNEKYPPEVIQEDSEFKPVGIVKNVFRIEGV